MKLGYFTYSKLWPSLKSAGKQALFLLITAMLTVSADADQLKRWSSTVMEHRLHEELRVLLEDAQLRHPGTPGNLVLEEKVAQKIAATGLQHGEMKFPAPVFIPGATLITPNGADPIKVMPMHPTLFRPGNFAEREFEAPLVYLGKGSVADMQRLDGVTLADSIGVMEFDSGAAWVDWMRFGVKGFVFLEPDHYDRYDALTKLHATEVAVPRFLARGEDARVLRDAAERNLDASINAEPSRWENRNLRNLWVFIPGSDPALSGEVAVFTAPLDANCIVPELSYGAQTAGNIMLLLRMLELFKDNPPERSVLLAAVNAHTQHFRGERMLAWHLLSDRNAIEDLRDTINADLRLNKVVLKHYEQLHLDKFRPEDEELLIRWRTLVDDTTGRNIIVKKNLVSLIQRNVNRIKEKMSLLPYSGLAEDEQETLRLELEAEKDKYVNVLILFNRVGIRTVLSDLTKEEVGILRDFVQEILEFNRQSAALNEADLAMDVDNGAIRNVIRGRRVSFFVTLDADWNSTKYGFSTGLAEARWATRWGGNAVRIADEIGAAAGDKPGLIVDTLSMRGGLSEGYYIDMETSDSQLLVSAPGFIQHAGQTPAFSLRNVFTSLGNSFLPTDTVDNIDKHAFAEGMVFLPVFWRGLLDDRHVTSSAQLGRPNVPTAGPLRSIQIKTYKYDEFSASVFPEIPVANSVVIIRPYLQLWAAYNPLNVGLVGLDGVVNADTVLTDLRASAVMYGLISGAEHLTSAAFRFDDDFINVNHTINAGEIHNKVDSGRLNENIVMALFECEEIPLYTMYDSSLAGNLPIAIHSIMVLTARGNASPRNFGLTGVMSAFTSKLVNPAPGVPAAFYMNMRDRFKLVTSQRRVALNASPEYPEGYGFLHPDEMDRDLFYNVVQDISVLNHARLLQLRDVADDLVRDFLERGDALLEKVKEARVGKRHLQYLTSLYESLGAQIKSYEQAKSTTDDMLKAVVVYMALLLPFCFFVQKLLFGFVKIEKEMGMFALLFSATFLVFRLIHPAFRVAQAAEAIFIAFVMGALGLFVISILRGRFEGEMQLLFRSFQGTVMEDDVGYSTVTQKAMLIGVNNMKRRRVRTMLTTATIILIAFTMLSFTSISKKVNPTIVARGRDVPYTGIMYHWPGRYTMDDNSLKVMRDLLSDAGQFLVRRWKVAPNDSLPLHVDNPDGGQVRADGVLGLMVEEDGFVDVLPLTAGRNFSADDAEEALLFVSMAGALGITSENLEDARVSVMGRELKVVGLLDDTLFRAIKDLNGLPLLPIMRIETDAGEDRLNPEATVQMSPTEDIHDMGALFHVESAALLVVPGETAERMGARIYSVSLKLDNAESLWSLVDLVLTSTSARFYMGSREPFAVDDEGRQMVSPGVYYIGSSYSTSVGGLAVLLIPLIIASTIILNTMLGSVYERKKEIAVYNAVGLNPHHIGMFFLAESFVYGVIGSVGGYLIGQVLSIVISHFNLVKGINFNYSSMSVAYVIMFTIAIVLLSTIYPAAVATRAAVPSGKRKWSLPPREGNTMSVIFPFIYTPQVAAGMIAYLRDYFSRFTAASIGDLIATPTLLRREKDEKGREFYLMDYHLALAPYDLGVTQDLRFRLAYDEKVQAYRLGMRIERVSGQDTNWVTTNKPFLERLRKYLMRWRNLDLAQQDIYVQQLEHFLSGVDKTDQ